MLTPLTTRISPLALAELGRKACARASSISSSLSTRWNRQDIFLRQAEDDFSYRAKSSDPLDSIFGEQNDSLNMVGGFSEYMLAKTCDDLFGSEPFFSITPEGKNDKILAELMQRHSEWRFRRADLTPRFCEAIKRSYEVGEGILKITNDPTTTHYERPAYILADMDGNYITQEDGAFFEEYTTEFVEVPASEDGTTPATTQIDGHPEIVLPPETQWVSVFLPESTTHGDPVTAAVLHHRDFLVSPTATSLKTADFVGHLFDLSLADAIVRWSLTKTEADSLRGEDANPKSQERKPDEGSEEEPDSTAITQFDDSNCIIQFCECYQTITIAGKPSRILLVVATSQEQVVYADYLANITPNGELPFFAIRPFPKTNRWWGRGMFEIYELSQNFIERHLNYIAYSNRKRIHPIKGVRRNNITNLADGEDIVLGPDTTLELRQDATLRDTVEFLEFPALHELSWEMMQLMMQFIQLRAGVTSAARGQVESLPQNTTATGINAMISQGTAIAKQPIRSIRNDFQNAARFTISLIYKRLEDEETFSFLEGENTRVLKLSAKQVRDLAFDVSITLTRFHAKEQAEATATAIEIIDRYLRIPEEEKDAVREVFVAAMKARGIDNADKVIRRASAPQQ